MSTFTLTVTIDGVVEKKLKRGGYKLCLCKKVGDAPYNVIWSGKTFLRSNTFRWTESYAVFGSEEFRDGALAHSATEEQDIEFNQVCELTSDCIMEPAKGPIKPTGKFTVDNECGADMHIGVQQALGGDPRNKTAIFVTKVVVKGETELQPRAKVIVFFDQRLETRMMFSRSVSRSAEIEYTGGVISQTAVYTGNEEWEVSKDRRPRLAYHPDKGFYPDEAPLL